MKTFRAITDFLDLKNIPYIHKEHAPTLTSEDSARIRGDKLSQGAKAILYKIEKAYYLFVMAADRKMDTKKIKVYFKKQGRKAKKTRFATPDELLEMTGLVPGSVPPFGQPILDFELFVDPSLTENEQISFNAGSLTNSLSIQVSDYLKVSGAVIFEFT